MHGYEVLGVIAALVGFMGYPAYMLHMRSAGIRPNRATWIIWAVVNWVTALSYHSAGAQWTSLSIYGFAVGATLLAITSVVWGEGGLSRFDKGCGVAAVLALALYVIAPPEYSMVLGLTTSAMGALPTVRKLWRYEGKESHWAYALWWTSSTTNLIGALLTPSVTLGAPIGTIVTPPLFYIAQTSIVLAFVLRERRAAKMRTAVL